MHSFLCFDWISSKYKYWQDTFLCKLMWSRCLARSGLSGHRAERFTQHQLQFILINHVSALPTFQTTPSHVVRTNSSWSAVQASQSKQISQKHIWPNKVILFYCKMYHSTWNLQPVIKHFNFGYKKARRWKFNAVLCL